MGIFDWLTFWDGFSNSEISRLPAGLNRAYVVKNTYSKHLPPRRRTVNWRYG
jgi:hypothetical protein